jgi:hypothetical protein
MAQSKRGEKTKAIRDHLTAHPGATNKEVIAALKEKGMVVPEGTLSSVRFKMRSEGKPSTKSAAATPAAKPAAKPAHAKPAAKSSGRGRRGTFGRKSNAIRKYLAQHPGAGPTEVVAALKQKGMTVTTGLVSNIRSRDKTGVAPAAKAAVASAPKAAGNGRAASASVNLDDLIEAKKLADRLGGLDKAKAALEALAKLV